MTEPAQLMWQFGPIGILVFLATVCYRLTSRQLQSAYDSHDAGRVRVHTTIYCINWVLIAVAVLLSFWTWNKLNVRPRYAVEGIVIVDKNDKVSFIDRAVYPREAGDTRFEWLMSSIQPLKGRCLTVTIARVGLADEKWSFPIKADYYDQTVEIYADAGRRPLAPEVRVGGAGTGDILKEGYRC